MLPAPPVHLLCRLALAQVSTIGMWVEDSNNLLDAIGTQERWVSIFIIKVAGVCLYSTLVVLFLLNTGMTANYRLTVFREIYLHRLRFVKCLLKYAIYTKMFCEHQTSDFTCIYRRIISSAPTLPGPRTIDLNLE